jgi:hypothetical protein
MNRRLLDYVPESEAFEAGTIARDESEWSDGTGAREAFGEFDEMELAAELLEVTSEAEFDGFLGGLIDRVGVVARSPVGQALAGILKDAARRAVPTVSRAIEQPLRGATEANIGAQVVKAAGQYFGLELEGLSPEDQEFEAAKSFVRFAGEAAKTAANLPADAPADAVAQTAVVRAARRFAPGLLSPGPLTNGRRVSAAGRGRWVRRGPNIIVVDS